MGITALGPRKKIINAIKELRNMNDHSVQAAKNNRPGTVNSERTNVGMSGNKLITEYFRGSISMVNGASCPKNPTESKKQTMMNTKTKPRKRSTRNGVAKDIPPWCWIAGTPFRVVLEILFIFWLINNLLLLMIYPSNDGVEIVNNLLELY
jgi:DNA cross-link repair 1A protein